ncbi:GGDEF domain-containing protein [Undibacterium terreum]|nr:GGDEF domain-containing protein [Undibacterium terreum]
MSIVLFSAYRSFPSTIKGLGWWAASCLLMLTTTVLFALRGIVPESLSIVACNLAMFVAVGFRLIGTQKFYGHEPALRRVSLIVVVGTTGAIWWTLQVPNFQMRLLLIAPLIALLYGEQLYVIAKTAERHFVSYFFGGITLIQIVLVLMRFATGFNDNVNFSGFHAVDQTLSVYLTIYSLMTITMAVGFIMVATRRLHVELARVSNVDPLTEALNRRAFSDMYDNEMRRIKRHERPMSLIIMDLDHFKRINDKHGHSVGDRVLIHFSSTVTRLLRETDHFARFGGEEFVALLPETTAVEAQAVARRICECLRQAGNAEIPAYTVSMGLAEVTSGEENLDSVASRADAALYKAKSEGRDRLELATPLKLVNSGSELACGYDPILALSKTGR